MGRFFVILTLGVVLFLTAMYYFEFMDDPTSGGSHNKFSGHTTKVADPKTLGKDLYEVKDFPTSLKQKIKGTDPVAFRGQIAPKERVDLAGQMSGEVLFIGQEVPEGTVQVAGLASFMAAPYDFAEVRVPDRKIVRIYKRLTEGAIINREDMIGCINPVKATGILFEKTAKLEVSYMEAEAAKATSDEASERQKAAVKLLRDGAMSREEFRTAEMTKQKYFMEYKASLSKVEMSKVEIEQAKIQILLHEIQNRISGGRAMIKKIYKDRGSSVRDQEPVFELVSVDQLVAEAQVDGQYEVRLLGEPRVTIEPTVDNGPVRVLPGHNGAITALGFTRDVKNPRVVVAASEDKYVSIWDRYSPLPTARLRHPEPVKSLVVARGGAAHNYLITGTDKGGLYVWDLDALGDNPEPKFFLKDIFNEQAVTALALSPDGQFVVAGSADGSISAWKLADKLVAMYAFDPEHGVDNPHQAGITSLHLTPQCRLVSAARDNTIRVWAMKEKGAHLLGDPIQGRTGNVSQLGVSRDGRWMLTDGERSLNLLSAKEMVMVNRLQNPSATTPFESVAEFSDDASLLLTAGATEGRLQLWRSPTETSRGFEVRQFVPEARSPATYAAFAPTTGAPEAVSLAASGAKNGEVYLWEVPSMQDVNNHRLQNVKLKLLRRDLDPNTGKFHVAVELSNSGVDDGFGRLISGRPVTIVIDE